MYGHIVAIKRDKKVSGLYIPAHVFFSLWGYWNIIYYSGLNQTASLIAGAILALANTYYTALLIKYSKGENNEK